MWMAQYRIDQRSKLKRKKKIVKSNFFKKFLLFFFEKFVKSKYQTLLLL